MDIVLKKCSFFSLIILVLSISFSGCAWLPWGSSDEEEVELESDFQEFEMIESEAPLEIEELREEIRTLQSEQEDAQLKIDELEDAVSSLAPRVREIEEFRNEIGENRAGMENTTSAEMEMLKDSVHQMESEIDGLKDNIAEMELEAKLRNVPKKVSKNSVRKSYDRALQLYNIKQYKESLSMFGSLDNQGTPNHLRDNVVFWSGQNYFQMQDYQKAIEKYTAVIDEYKSGNKVFDAKYMLGVTYSSLGEKSKALGYLEQALNDNPPSEVRNKIEKKIREIEG